MAIWVYSGVPGGGKTYSLVWQARRAWRRGTRIFSNVPFLLPDGSTPYKLVKEDFRKGLPPGSLAVISEAGQWYNSRDWHNFTPDDYKVFTLHRHLGINMIMDVHHPDRIDVSIRDLVEGIWWTRRVPVFPFLLQHAYLTVTAIGNEKKVFRRRLVPLRGEVYRAYDTTWERHRLPPQDTVFPPWEWGGKVSLARDYAVRALMRRVFRRGRK